ncbi:glyoxalase superfamily protein [Aureibacillus halotolerans]|uniref:Bleomycin resistance protein n=1 Tax=Aureibacillus halotolerans TaxID=1508390 RepID=A0A4R6UIG6_9BACI|nr:glyoxalase superfamily protein [Aureibacillus halotolerans]TDQ42964.1 hypothetical protein EV213_101395 [Aureibacillus halotolerans]
MNAPIPILRFFDEELTKHFYCDFLGFTVDWTHRFEEDFPLYMQVSKDKCILHLSEHYGDSSPGAALRIEVGNIETFQKQLLAQQASFARPGLEDGPAGGKECTVTDPAYNRLVFYENKN